MEHVNKFTNRFAGKLNKGISIFAGVFAILSCIVGTQTAIAQSTSFTTPSATPVTYTVPTGCTIIGVTMTGGCGGNSAAPGGNTSGLGGLVVCTYSVVPGQVLNVYVGGQADTAPAAGVGACAGGIGGTGTGTYFPGGGGGGSSAIRIGGTAIANTVLEAAGGGGGAGNGAGYRVHGGDAYWPTGIAGGNGTAPAVGGGGGTQAAGGTGGAGTGTGAGTAGTQTVGGNEVMKQPLTMVVVVVAAAGGQAAAAVADLTQLQVAQALTMLAVQE